MPLTKRTDKPLSEVVKERREAPRFDDAPMPDDDPKKAIDPGRAEPRPE